MLPSFRHLFCLQKQMKQKTAVSIREHSWLARLAAKKLGYDHVAIVWGRTIHLHQTSARSFLSNRRWLLHELKHVAQYDHYGFAGFLCRYLWDNIRRGYHQNRFEVAARAAEKDETLLEQYRIVWPAERNIKG